MISIVFVEVVQNILVSFFFVCYILLCWYFSSTITFKSLPRSEVLNGNKVIFKYSNKKKQNRKKNKLIIFFNKFTKMKKRDDHLPDLLSSILMMNVNQFN